MDTTPRQLGHHCANCVGVGKEISAERHLSVVHPCLPALDCINKNYLTYGLIVNTLKSMNITHDLTKDAANLAKHGVSLALAVQTGVENPLGKAG